MVLETSFLRFSCFDLRSPIKFRLTKRSRAVAETTSSLVFIGGEGKLKQSIIFNQHASRAGQLSQCVVIEGMSHFKISVCVTQSSSDLRSKVSQAQLDLSRNQTLWDFTRSEMDLKRSDKELRFEELSHWFHFWWMRLQTTATDNSRNAISFRIALDRLRISPRVP